MDIVRYCRGDSSKIAYQPEGSVSPLVFTTPADEDQDILIARAGSSVGPRCRSYISSYQLC